VIIKIRVAAVLCHSTLSLSWSNIIFGEVDRDISWS
jgi:hypothetical protein